MSALAFATSMGVTTSAWAHASLAASEPTANAALSSAPKQVRLQFSEPLEAKFSGIEVKDAAGKVTTSEKATIDASAPSEMRLALPTLTTGAYQVRWNAVTRDGHRVKGEYGFTVK
ncbi:MAG: copper homeostasis periplasmic binding protein CopC [Burkholderiaceae bacterium]